jgi:translocation and assembly module TamA
MNRFSITLRRFFVQILCCCIGIGTCCPAIAGEAIRVDITGLDGELLKNVKLTLSIAEAAKAQKSGFFSGLTQGPKPQQRELDERAIRRMHRQADKEIRQALQPFGYYTPRVDAKLEKTEDEWRAAYAVDPGPATLLRQVEIEVAGEGRNLPSVKTALASMALKPGGQLDHRAYEKAKSSLSDALYEAGFVDAKFTRSEIKVFPEEGKADIYLLMASGPQYYFGPITIEQDILQPEFVARLSNIKEGDRFDARKLIDLQLALQESGYFSQAEILAEREKAVDARIPVVVKTVPTKPRRYTFGFGYGTDTGPRFTAGTEWRRLNDKGHKMRVDLRLTAIEQSLSAQYLIPLKNVLSDSLAFTASASREFVGDIDTNQFKVGASLNEKWLAFRRRLYLSLERENFDLGAGSQTSNLLIPGMELSRRSFDDLIYPRRGYSAALDIHGGIESPLTETTFLHTHVTARSVWPLTRRSRLLLRGEFGAIRAATFSDLPPSQRFYAGGDQSVRGYGYQKLGPKNSEGDVIGGRYLATASLEADYLVYNDIGLAVFFDAGNAADVYPFELNRSWGIGLRYRSPVAMIRLDLARPLDDPDTNIRFHLSIGADL